MATLLFSPVRVHPAGTIEYIADKDKVVSDRVHDVHNVLAYMGEPESTERVYAFARHYSTNPKLAAKQAELDRQRYYENKKSAKPHEGELLGLHFFQSYTVEDDPSDKVMTEIAMKLAEHPLIRDFGTFGSNHFDKPQKHSHIYASQFSAVGKPRKMCLEYEDIKELRRYMNRLCVERGLSIIDKKDLRTDPEYSDWVDQVIAKGLVTVHAEKPNSEDKPPRRRKATSRQLYYKWMKEQEEFDFEEYRKLTPGQQFAKNYYYTFDNRVMYPVSGDTKGRVYAIPIKDENGRRRSTLELTIRLIMTIVKNESAFIRHEDRVLYNFLKSAEVDWGIQNAYNCVCTARELNVESPNDIPARLADIGKQMNAQRREKVRHERSIEKQERIIEAYEIYTRVRPLVEGVDEPLPEDVADYKAAYAILTQNQILTAEAYRELCLRRNFEKQKVADYARRMPELNRQYRDLKRLQALTANPAGLVEMYYSPTIPQKEKGKAIEYTIEK